MPEGAQAGQAGGQFQVQPGNGGGQPLGGQRDHVARLGGLAAQQPGGVPGDPVSPCGRAVAAGQAPGAGRRGRISELGHALVQGLGGPGGQRAGAEQQQVTRLQPGAGRRPGGADAERAGVRGRQAAGPAVSPGDHWGRLAAGGVLERAAGRAEHGQHQRAAAQPGRRGGKAVSAGHRGRQVVLGGEHFAEHGAQLAHARDGWYSRARDGAYSQRNVPAGEWHRIEPAAAWPRPGRAVAGGDPHPGQHRQASGQMRGQQLGSLRRVAGTLPPWHRVQRASPLTSPVSSCQFPTPLPPSACQSAHSAQDLPTSRYINLPAQLTLSPAARV